MPLKLYKAGFSVGQIDIQAGGRVDIDRYALAAKRIENYIVTPIGTLRRRPGTIIHVTAKFSNLDVRLERFEFNIDQAYMLEMGQQYIRFYRNRARINLPATTTAVEVTTPYLASEVRDIQMVQTADVLYLAHPNHPPARLIRISDQDWRYEVIPLSPGPTTETDIALFSTVTPSALSGLVDLVSTIPVFLEGDIGRTFRSGTTEGVITEVIPEPIGAPFPSGSVRVLTTSPFTSLAPIVTGDWTVSSTPDLDIRVSFTGENKLGASVELRLESDVIPPIIFANVAGTNNLVQSGDFQVFLGWEDQSGTLVTDGTFTGGNPPQVELVDDSKDFVLAGVQPGHRVLNNTQGAEGIVGLIRSIIGATNNNSVIDLNPFLAPTAAGEWNAADLYQIRETGSITHDLLAQELLIRGGVNGRGAIGQQSSANGINERFQLRVDVRRQPVIVQIASSAPIKFGAAKADVLGETTLEVGTQTVVFKTDSLVNHYIQFSNTQDIDTAIDNVIVYPMTRTGWRLQDVGRLIRVGGGLVEVTGITGASEAQGVIRAVLTDTPNADDDVVVQSGLWRLGVASWSASQGYPRAVGIHQQRLWFAGTAEQPLTLWASRTADFTNFNLGPNDSDALELEISANELNSIRWIEPLGDLLLGTAGGEHLIQGGTSGITPASAFQSPQTTFGSTGLRPIRHDNVVYLLARGGRQIWEITTDGDTGLLAGRNVTRLTPDITLSRIKEWSLQSWPEHIIWAIREDGTLVGLTLDLAENVRAWHQHKTPGRFLSLAVIPSVDAQERLEDVWLAVSRDTPSGPVVFIELFEDRINTSTEVREPLTLDCAGRGGDPAGPVTTTQVGGLIPLEGQTVGMVERREVVQADGRTGERFANLGTAVVTGGIVTLPQAAAGVDVGLLVTPTVELLRPSLDMRDGNLQFREQRVVKVDIRTVDTVGFLTVNEDTLDVRVPSDLMDTGFEPEDKDLCTRALQGWDGDGFVVIAQPLPFPSHLVSVGIELQAEEME